MGSSKFRNFLRNRRWHPPVAPYRACFGGSPLARQHYRQEHPTLANVNVGGIHRRPVWFDVDPVKVMSPDPFESIDLSTCLVSYRWIFLGAEYAL